MEELKSFLSSVSDAELNDFALNNSVQMCAALDTDKILWDRLYAVKQLIKEEISVRVKNTSIFDWKELLYKQI